MLLKDQSITVVCRQKKFKYQEEETLFSDLYKDTYVRLATPYLYNACN